MGTCAPFFSTMRASMMFVPTTYCRVIRAFSGSGLMSTQRWCLLSCMAPPSSVSTRSRAGQYSIPRWSIFDAALREDAFLVGVLHFAHFRYGIGQLHEKGVGVAPGQDDVHHLRLALQRLGDISRIEHPVADGVINFVQHHQVPFTGVDSRMSFFPRRLHQANVFGIGFSATDLHKPSPHLPNHKVALEVRSQGLRCVELAVMPRALDELQHEHLHAASDGAQSRAQRRGGLAFAGSSIDQYQSAT